MVCILPEVCYQGAYAGTSRLAASGRNQMADETPLKCKEVTVEESMPSWNGARQWCCILFP